MWLPSKWNVLCLTVLILLSFGQAEHFCLTVEAPSWQDVAFCHYLKIQFATTLNRSNLSLGFGKQHEYKIYLCSALVIN